MCDATFTGSILIVGMTCFKKTYFTKKLAVNTFFGGLKKVEWVSYINLSRERKAEIDSCFSCKVEFHYPKSIEQFHDLLEIFKARSKTTKKQGDSSSDDESYFSSSDDEESSNDEFGRKATCDWVTVMDDVSGLTDELKRFASFLIVTRKLNYICVYIFHIIYSEKTIWMTILSHTKIFNIFPASISATHVRKILETVCIRKTRKYITLSALWISRLFIELANRHDSICLTLDCSGVNKEGLDRFRTEADKPDYQTCYFNVANDEQSYNEFFSQRINSGEADDRIQFNIIHLKSKANRGETFDASEELRDLNKNNGSGGTTDKRSIFETKYGRGSSSSNSSGRNSTELFISGTRGRAKPKFLLGR